MTSAALDDATDGEEQTFLVEIVAATLPRGGRRGGDGGRGVHCTATWVGPVNPLVSWRRRRERLLHRTRTVRLDRAAAAAPPANEEDDSGAERVFTVDDDALFLLRTTTRQLVGAAASDGAPGTRAALGNGGLRVDVFDTPLDVMSSVKATVLAQTIAEREARATTRATSCSASYRLVG